ncbi:MAG: PD40 domain-containing protein [Acidobacteria bacterium]|nr:PD40 domain-containing protein [Acidobacteriota bacterium]
MIIAPSIPFPILLALLALPAAGQETQVNLEARTGSLQAIAFSLSTQDGLDLDWANVHFGDVIRKDLSLTGVFREMPVPSPQDPNVKAEMESPFANGHHLFLKVSLGKSASGGYSAQAETLDPRAGKSIFGKSYTGSEAVLRRMAHRLVDDLVARITGLRGVAESRILFAKEISSGVKELYQVDRDGHSVRPLTRLGSLTITPSVSADGRLAFLTYKAGPPELWGQQQPDGPFIRLYPSKPSQGGTISTPVWSPDGKRLAFVEGDRRGNTNIKVLDIASRRVRLLTDKSGINTEPAWNPSGTQIAFTSDRAGYPDIYLMEDDGSNVRRLTSEGKYNASPAWSPDGSMIAYVSRFESGFDLFVYKLAEGKAYQLTRGPGSSESPAWSPDGRFLVYTNNASGSSRLYTTDLAGNAPQQLSDISPTQSPEWTRSR